MAEEIPDWAFSLAEQLAVLPGAPRRESGLLIMAEGLIRIVRNWTPEQWVAFRPHYAEVFRKLGNPASDLDWLKGRILADYETWPAPAEIRSTYAAEFLPADRTLSRAQTEYRWQMMESLLKWQPIEPGLVLRTGMVVRGVCLTSDKPFVFVVGSSNPQIPGGLRDWAYLPGFPVVNCPEWEGCC